MITLNIGTHTFTLTQQDAVYLVDALGLTLSRPDKKLPVHHSARLGKVTVFAQSDKVRTGHCCFSHPGKPGKSDQNLTDC